MNTTTKITTGFIAGTLLGAALGLLFAPYKGVKTRSIITDKAKDVSDATLNSYAETKDKLLTFINKDKNKNALVV